jgi:crossover junction endodeoxyribonuclease RuvC
LKIHEELETILNLHSPDCLAIEQIFFAKNARAALMLGHARGVILLSAGISGIPVFEYSATAIKTALCRFGRSTKEQVSSMVKVLLHLEGNIPTHAADALAACICHIHTRGNSWPQRGTRSGDEAAFPSLSGSSIPRSKGKQQ